MFKSFYPALAASFLLSACGGAAQLPSSESHAALRSADTGCPTPPSPGSQEPATISIELPAGQSLLVGHPAKVTVTLNGFDSYGSIIYGNFKSPVKVSLRSTFPGTPRITLACTTVYATGQTSALTYDGKADVVNVVASHGGKVLGKPGRLATFLPDPAKLHGGVIGSTIHFDPNGNFWSEGRAKNPLTIALARVDANLNVKTFIDSNKSHYAAGGLFVDRTGGVWTGFAGNRLGIERFDPKSGHFSSYVVPQSMINAGSVSSISQDRYGSIWFSTVSADVGLGYYVAILKGASIKLVGSVSDPPYNLTPDPKGSGMWFSAGTALYHVQGDGSMRSANIASTYGTADAARFALGPDGNWWIPYPFGKKLLVKVGTNCQIISRRTIPYLGGERSGYQPDVNGDFARDSEGNLFESDPDGDGLIRFTPTGEVSEIESHDMYQFAVQGLDAAKDGTLYLLIQGGIAKLSPHWW